MITYLQGLAIFCLAIVPTSFCYDNIHDDKTFDRIQEAILTGAKTDRKYEIVPIQLSERLHKRDIFLGPEQHMFIRVFEKDIDLWLHPRDSMLADKDTPVYYARYAPDQPQNVKFELRTSLMNRLAQYIWENPAELASVVIGTGEYGRTTVNGRLGKRGIIIRSLSQKVMDEYVRKRRSIDRQDNSSNLNYHLVYEDDNSRDVVDKKFLNERLPDANSHQIPYILYPEILVLVEYDMYKSHQRDIYRFLEYLLAFWNGVDLKYRCLEAPRIRLNIAGIIFAVDPWALSYITENKTANGKTLNVDRTHILSTKFLVDIKESFPLDSYDVAVTMTKRGLGPPERGILGQAYPMSACNVTSNSTNNYAMALVQDDGTFSGVHTAAHELGHAFALYHDPDDDNDCNASNGFIMSYVTLFTTNSSMFSRCSLRQFDKRLHSGQLKCLYNRPRTFSKQLPKMSPGKIASLDKQCRSRESGVEAACEPENYNGNFDVCVNYWCRINGQCRETGTPAVVGTPCRYKNREDFGFCLHNQCVRLEEYQRN